MRHTRLRHTLAAVAGVVLLVAFVNLLSGGRNFVVAAITAAIIFVLILFEVTHYRPNVASGRGTWQRTQERFVDPTSGEQMDVYFNPQTGERDYRRTT